LNPPSICNTYITRNINNDSPLEDTHLIDLGIEERIRHYSTHQKTQSFNTPRHLAQFTGGYTHSTKQGITFEWQDYLKLIDWTGRAIHDTKSKTEDTHLIDHYKNVYFIL